MKYIVFQLLVWRNRPGEGSLYKLLLVNSLSKDYPHPDDHAKQMTDTPGFKPYYILVLVNTKPVFFSRSDWKFAGIVYAHVTHVTFIIPE